jgi:hypothetical protein
MRLITLILLAVLLAGCRTFEIGFVQTPTPDRTTADQATATPTNSPTPAATVTIAPATVEPTATATITPSPTRQPTRRPTSHPIVQAPTTTPLPDSPAIVNFSVEPLEVDPGDTVTLRWSVANVNSIDIFQHVPDTLPSYNTVNLSATGQITQTIRDQQRLWQSFELSASNAFGVITQAITVAIRCPYAYFFSPLPVEDREEWDCPDGPPIASSAAEQSFENGRMIWLAHDDRIYAFFDDGTYQTFEDTWVAGQPDTDPALVPPAGRVVPVRGFGKVWSGDADVRSRLGWALAAEQGFETHMQGGWIHCCSRLGTVNRPIYLSNIEGRTIRLWPSETPLGQWKWVE